jgi:HK97 family phage major capsid protein
MVDAMELIRKRAKAWETAKGMVEKAKGEKRDTLNAEEEEAYQKICKDMDDLTKQIEMAEDFDRRRLQMAAAAEGAAVVGGKGQGADEKGGDGATIYGTKAYATAFKSFLRSGLDLMPPQERATLQVDSDTGGGMVVVSEQFVAGVIKAADALTPFRAKARRFTLAYNETLGAVSLDSDVGDFTFGVGELTEAEVETGIALGKRELKPHPIRRKVVKISKRLIESANPKVDVEALVTERVGFALARSLEQKYMTGSGALEPLGVFTASADGIPSSRWIATGNTTTAIKEEGLINAQDTLRDPYQPQAEWLMHRDALTKIRKLKTTEGQFLWQPGLQLGQPNLLLGKAINTSEYAPKTFTAGLAAALYGDFSYYWIADAASMAIQRLVELYSLTGQVGLLFDKLAADGMPVLGEAFVVMCMAAS